MAAGSSALLRLRGLPYNATEEEIKGFFGEFQTVNVSICRHDGEYTRWRNAAVELTKTR